MTAPEQTSDSVTAVTPQRQPYTPPELRRLGDLRDLTLGGSPGTGDSGNAATQQF